MNISANRRFLSIRTLLGKTQAQFAFELGCHTNTLHRVEKEKNKLPTKWITYLSDKYNISPTWILLGKGELFC